MVRVRIEWNCHYVFFSFLFIVFLHVPVLIACATVYYMVNEDEYYCRIRSVSPMAVCPNRICEDRLSPDQYSRLETNSRSRGRRDSSACRINGLAITWREHVLRITSGHMRRATFMRGERASSRGGGSGGGRVRGELR